MTTDPLIGKQLGDYRIVDILGRGGMAHVYRGFDRKLQRYAAVKVIDSNLLASNETDEEYRARFQREARAIAHLSHPNIVGVYQFGEVGSLYYMAMAFIEGRDLGQMLKEHAEGGTSMPREQIIQIIRDISAALDHAHTQGVIHRDIKPSNIMVTREGRAVLTDFGLALSVPEGSIGNTFGSAHYIAPEQAISSAKALPQSDLYSLGVVLYQMLTGKVPFDDPSAMSVALKHLSEPPPPVRLYNPRVSPAVERVVMKALEKEPSKRYRTGESMADALEEALLNLKTDSKPSHPSKAKIATGEYRRISAAVTNPDAPRSLPKPPPKPARRRRSPVLVLASAVLLIALIVGAVTLLNGRGTPPTLTPTAGTALVALITDEATSMTADALTDETESPLIAVTDEATADASPTLEPTTTDTRMPTVTPTPEPTNTLVPTVTPSDSPTSPPLPSDALVVTNAPPTLEPVWIDLTYSADEFVLINRQPAAVDVRDLSFVQTLPDGQTRSVLTDNVPDSISRIAALRQNDCIHLWRYEMGELPKPDECRARQGFRGYGTPRQFWVNVQNPDATFEVRREDVVLGVCQISAGTCRINLRQG